MLLLLLLKLSVFIIVTGTRWQQSAGLASDSRSNRSFVIDYETNQFLKDEKPFRYISGCLHYFRVPEFYWRDRLLKLQAAGLTAVQTYVPWNIHEPFPGKYDFEGQNNITRFLEAAQDVGLYVILRAGPFICGDVDNGGFPWWLYKIPGLKTRVAEPQYLSLVAKWYKAFFPMVVPYLYKNGGPIITIQVENEYGWMTDLCDHAYMAFLSRGGRYQMLEMWVMDKAKSNQQQARDELKDLFRQYVGNDTVLFTVDNLNANWTCGSIQGVYPTVDFAPWDNVTDAFAVQRRYAPKGPLVNTEYYTGWGSRWDYPYRTGDTDPIVTTLGEIYRMNASVNFYMFEGGSNFGYQTAGVTMSPYSSILQTYDYDAPLTENGDTTTKYQAIRTAIQVLTGERLPYPVPPPVTRKAYGQVKMTLAGTIIEFLNKSFIPVSSTHPQTFEELNFPYGFILYETTLQTEGKNLTISRVCDRGYVMLGNRFVGLLARDNSTSIIVGAKQGESLRVHVENMGRNQDGWQKDPKGILSNATIDGQILVDWRIYRIDLERLSQSKRIRKIISSRQFKQQTGPFHRRHDNKRKIHKRIDDGFVPSIFFGNLAIPGEPSDTFFDPTGWGKGQLLINGQNVGRYWPSVGPQITIWVPAPWLNKGANLILMMELEKVPANETTRDHEEFYFVNFRDTAKLH